MKVKERITHYNNSRVDPHAQESIKNEICSRVKAKLDDKQKRIKVEILQTNKVCKSSKAKEIKVPKRNLGYHQEAAYAAAPIARQSTIILAEISAKVKEFREVSKRAAQKKIVIRPVNWQ